MKKIIPFVHNILKQTIKKTDITIDATCGNGQDTLVLAKLSQKVYAFDIQEEALSNTLVKMLGYNNIEYIKDSHANMDLYVKQNVQAVVFNLGYLPKGNKEITTKYTSTLIAIKKALNLLDVNGIISIVIYPGHPEGLLESVQIKKFAQALDQRKHDVILYAFINQANDPPFVIIIKKLSN